MRLAEKFAPAPKIRQETKAKPLTTWSPTTDAAGIAPPVERVQTLEGTQYNQPPKGPAKPDEDWRVVGEIPPGSTPEEISTLETYDDMSRAYKHLEAEQNYRANMVSEEGLRQLDWLAQRDQTFTRKIIDEGTAKFKQANAELDYDIDMARKLQSNPYNYMQQLGRAGRVAAVLSVGVNQLAVGAGQPNNVLARLENAINKDIADQKTVYDQTWAGIEARGIKNDADLAFVERQFAWEDKAKAVAYAAASARIGAALQSAQTEMSYAALQMVKAEADARQAVHTAEARRKDGVIYYDGKVATGAQALNRRDQILTVKNETSRQMGFPGGQAAPPGTITTRGGQVYGTEGAQAPAGPLPTAPAPAPEQAAPVAAVGAPVRAEARSRRKGPSGPVQAPAPQVADTLAAAPETAQGGPAEVVEQAPPEEISDFSVPEQLARPVEQKVPDALKALEEEQDAPKGDKRTDLQRWSQDGEIPEATLDHIRSMYTEEELAAGGRARWEAERAGRTRDYGGPPLAVQLEAISHRPANIALAWHPDEAYALAQAYPPPSPKMYNLNSKNPQERNAQALIYNKDVERWKWLRARPSAFEASTLQVRTEKGFGQAMQTNTFEDDYLGTYRILRSSTMSLATPEAMAELNLLKTKLASRGKAAMSLMQAANVYQRTGAGSFLGFKFTDTGATFTPFDEADMSDQAILHRYLTEAGINAIKSADPSGRLTDKDIEVGKGLVSAMQSGAHVKWDILQGIVSTALGRPITEGEVRLAARRFFAFAAKSLFESYAHEVSPHIMMTPEGDAKQKGKFRELQQFIDDSQPAAEMNTPRTWIGAVKDEVLTPFIAINMATTVPRLLRHGAKKAMEAYDESIPMSTEKDSQTLQPQDK
jgi:hypothetical protein